MRRLCSVSGNHIWDKKEALGLLETEQRLLRPANYPDQTPGRGAGVYTSRTGDKVGVLNLQGRVFMDPINCPFAQAEKELEWLKLLFGKVGRRVIKSGLNNIVANTKAEFVIANGENLAGGFGLTRETIGELFNCGVDVITSGNHIWDKKEALGLLETEQRLLRPANYPDQTPGRGAGVYTSRTGDKVGVLNLQGRVFMDPINCPFAQAEKELEWLKPQVNIIVTDLHAEATSEKMAMAFFLDGRVSAVIGSHTHVQTSDARIMPRDTAYITDMGMTGPSHSIIGVRPEIILKRFITKLPERFNEATGPGQFNGVLLEIDSKTGKAKSIKSIQTLFDS